MIYEWCQSVGELDGTQKLILCVTAVIIILVLRAVVIKINKHFKKNSSKN